MQQEAPAPPKLFKSPLRGLLIGLIAFTCIVCLLITAVAVRAIASSQAFASFRANAEFAASELPNLAALRDRLLVDHPSQDLGAQVTWRQQVGSPEAALGLAITFQNPDFEVPSANAERQELARNIASEVATTYPRVTRVDFISVTFTNVRGVGITLSTALTYVFQVEDLLDSPSG